MKTLLRTTIPGLFLDTDLRAVRFLLAWASLIWAVAIVWPGEGFERSAYAPMRGIAIEEVWILLYCLHGLATMASVLKLVRHRALVVFEGLLGVFLWTVPCISILYSIYPPPPAIGTHIACMVASWWILVRYPRGQNRGR